jgi:uncharacterized protein (DUF2384 family)
MGATTMTTDEEAASMHVIELCRTFNRRMAEQQAANGARPEDIAIAAVASAVDLAQQLTGDQFAAIAWARRAIDVLEQQLPLTVETIQ